MKLHAFHANDGDCLLLESKGGQRVLIDGGRSGSFKENTLPVLTGLADDGQALDLVIVSHIDADHISGIIPLLDAVQKWASFEFQLAHAADGKQLRAPKVPKPPDIKGVWHNSWRIQLGELADQTDNLAHALALAVEVAFGSDSDAAGAPALAMANLATSIEQGEELMLMVEGSKVPIPFNAGFDGLVLRRRPVHVEQVGRLKLSVLGPSRADIDDLRKEFRKLTEKSPQTMERAGRGGGPALGLDGVPLEVALQESRDLIREFTAEAEIITEADASAVTVPNRASIIVLAEEDGKRCLLTGDAAVPEILAGLKAAKLLKKGAPFRCNVLKVQHHCAEHNVDQVLAEQVLAEHYVLSGDGAAGNPNPSAVRTLIETRLAADPATPFTVWFTTSDTRGDSGTKRAVMREAIAEATKAEQNHGDLVTVRVLPDDEPFHTIEF